MRSPSLYASALVAGIGASCYLYLIYLRDKNKSIEKELEMLQAKENERKLFLIKAGFATVAIGTGIYVIWSGKRYLTQKLF